MTPVQAFELDPLTKEPFLRLPEPHSDIILTPPRLSDAESIVPILNDPLVYPTLEGPPYPYEHQFAIDWLSRAKEVTDKVWASIQSGSSHEKFGASPVRIIRQVDPVTGAQVYLGDCGIDRWGYRDIEPDQERQKLEAENLARPNGDPKIVWTIGGRLIAETRFGLDSKW